MSTPKCPNCNGQGGVPHDDVPLAICAKCNGFGDTAKRPPHVFFNGISVQCEHSDRCCGESVDRTGTALFCAMHAHGWEAP